MARLRQRAIGRMRTKPVPPLQSIELEVSKAVNPSKSVRAKVTPTVPSPRPFCSNTMSAFVRRGQEGLVLASGGGGLGSGVFLQAAKNLL